jgi:zinc ribbon protein
MTCSKCSTELPQNARYCPQCGMRLGAGGGNSHFRLPVLGTVLAAIFLLGPISIAILVRNLNRAGWSFSNAAHQQELTLLRAEVVAIKKQVSELQAELGDFKTISPSPDSNSASGRNTNPQPQTNRQTTSASPSVVESGTGTIVVTPKHSKPMSEQNQKALEKLKEKQGQQFDEKH